MLITTISKVDTLPDTLSSYNNASLYLMTSAPISVQNPTNQIGLQQLTYTGELRTGYNNGVNCTCSGVNHTRWLRPVERAALRNLNYVTRTLPFPQSDRRAHTAAIEANLMQETRRQLSKDYSQPSNRLLLAHEALGR